MRLIIVFQGKETPAEVEATSLVRSTADDFVAQGLTVSIRRVFNITRGYFVDFSDAIDEVANDGDKLWFTLSERYAAEHSLL
jgi:hypothetical protein